MNTNVLPFILLILSFVSACQAATPSPVAAKVDAEFTLAPSQSAAVEGTDLTITFRSVAGDDRCPSEVECAASGPVDVLLSVQNGDEESRDFNLQTFTDHKGIAPSVPFEGLTNPIEVAGYLIRIAGVIPYPEDPEITIEPSDYRVTLLVSNP
jgi:hypothetical protein